jgi:hypothetical protein
MNEVKRTAWAQVVANGDFICVQTYSGYRRSIADPQGKEHLLSPEVDDSELGAAILDALAASRFVTPQEDLSLFDFRLVTERYEAWLAALIAKYGYKSKSALLKKMNNCGIERCDGVIEIHPRCHENLETWTGTGISRDDHVVVRSDSPLVEVGAAARIALGRCT